MKEKICISIDTETLFKIQERVSKGSFRNRSHIIEFAVKKLLDQTLKEV